jgi:hypothetical protein
MIRYFWPSDDEQLAGQFVDSHFDEDGGWWASVQQCGATLAIATALTLAASSTTLATSVFSQSQDDPALAAQILAIEEYWQNPTPPAVWPQPSVLTDDDVHPTFVPVFTPDDGDWQALVPPAPATNYLFLPFLDPEQSPTFTAAVPVVDDSSVWAPALPPADSDWNVLFFLDDGSWVPAMEPDEDFWAPQLQPQNWPQPSQPFAVADEQVPQFPAEDDFWPQYVAPVPASLLWPQQFQFEQFESTNLIAFVEDVFWQNPTPPVPATYGLLQQWPFEQNEPAGSLNIPAFEETLWQNQVPPVPDGLRLQQQWVFEQNEPGSLRTNQDEDFWINPVAPVVFVYQQPFLSDELVVPQSASTIDEVYWASQVSPIVFPVPATSILVYPYQPDPEEIPAGSLVPFIPPPPVFCPLPPSGPDADTSISIFGGAAHPTLALFCRICNSGKPLVVRGDYAIWCQDCCAFVSKADTYMGTIRAPGQFKSIF